VGGHGVGNGHVPIRYSGRPKPRGAERAAAQRKDVCHTHPGRDGDGRCGGTSVEGHSDVKRVSGTPRSRRDDVSSWDPSGGPHDVTGDRVSRDVKMRDSLTRYLTKRQDVTHPATKQHTRGADGKPPTDITPFAVMGSLARA